ncbi:MAG TPA: oxidase [Devosia sp.]|nr:oxidase [Devosia sp.]
MSNSITGLTRRKLLLGTAALGAAATAGVLVFGQSSKAAGHIQSSNPLKIPPLEAGRMQGNTRIYDLDIQHGQTEFFGGMKAPTMGINGSYLGPVLRMRQDEDIRINVTNSLDETATLHWHGFNLPAIADGGPHQIINPGSTWSPEFKVLEKASTMWYHSHLMGKTAEHVWAGIAGMIIVDDEPSSALDLPNNYGVDDLPVALQDRRFLRDGTMPYAPTMHDNMMGKIGDTPMANGTIGAWFDTTTSLVRLRLLNASNGSIYSIGFSDGRFFKKIATDGGLLAAPVDVQLMSMGPGERAEIVVDLSDGKNVTLTHFVRISQSEVSPEFAFLELRPAANSTTSKPVPATLATLPPLNPEAATNTRRFDLDMRGMMGMGMGGGGFMINGEQMDMKVINHTIKKDTVEIWEIRNLSRMSHPFHVHNTQFRILDRDGRPPEPHEDGLKDTVLVLPGRSARILISFNHYTDEKVPYMYHCHILEHEDAGMMGQFTVV